MASFVTDPWRALKVLDYIETGFDLIGPLKVKIQTLRLTLNFLFAILRGKQEQHIEDGGFKSLVTRVDSVILNEYMELVRLYSDFYQIASRGRWSLPINLYSQISGMLEWLELLKPDIQDLYTILSKSSRCIAEMTNESVGERLNSLLQIMGHMLWHKADFIIPVKEELQAVERGLRFLRNFLGFAASRCCKLRKLKDLQIHAEIVADNIACLLYLCCVNDMMDDQTISWMKFELLSQVQRISPAQPEVRKIYIHTLKSLNSAACKAMTAESILGFLDSLRENLSELLENNPGFSTSVKDQMLALHKVLRFLECLVVDSPIEEEHADLNLKLKDLCEHRNMLIDMAACVIYSFYDDEKDDIASQRNSLASGLLETFTIAKEEARQIYDKLVPKYLRANFPSTNAEGFIDSLVGNLKQLLNSNADSIGPLKHHIEPVLDELLSLREDFCKTQKQPSEQELKDQWTHFKDVAYQTDHVIDSLILAKDGEIWFHKLALFDVNEEMKSIKTGFNHVRTKMAEESTVLQKISSFSRQISFQDLPKDGLVVFEHEFEKIKEQLTYGSPELRILSIVGMPGVGKTTLANTLFKHYSVIDHFHVRLRCCVSQAYDCERLLVKILQQVKSRSLDFNDEELDHKLCQSLRGRRYLIFLDDIWDLKLLEDMRFAFPDDGNGSRIVVTSRLENVASQAIFESVTYHLSPLSDDKSWEMLQFKLFGKDCCPRELVEVGKQIAASCRGLPLTIDLVAGILREMERTQQCWLQLAQTLLTEFVDDPQGKCRKVLEISYNDLPYHLRPCFLYFGAFPEDIEIRARSLELIWIAEGFVQLPENDERSLEDVAQTYLHQLISRSLIRVSEGGSWCRVKKNHIHDLLRDFAVKKAIEERFLLPINGFSDFSTLSSDGYPWLEQYRLCIHPDYREQFLFSNPSGPRVRSLVLPYERYQRLSTDKRVFDYPINFSNFRILRVFNLPDIHIKHISSVPQLSHIRFLALESCEQEVFSAILLRLQNLETLKLERGIDGGGILSLADIDNMARLRFLRHFKVLPFVFPCISQEIFEKQNPVGFDNLHYLSYPFLRCGEDHDEKFMRPMLNLWNLKLGISSRNLNSTPKLDFLKNLESLTITGMPDREYMYHTTSVLSFPPYLKKLTLISLYLPWTNISALGKLEHLEVLKFKNLKSSTDIFNTVEFDQQFPKLKFLQLCRLDIKEWDASMEDFPVLKRLEVYHCVGLEVLPSCLVDIPTLQEIVLLGCHKSLVISAEDIKEEQVEQGNEQLLVIIEDIIDEDPFAISETYSEECLSVIEGSCEDP